jgi:ribonuclease HI
MLPTRVNLHKRNVVEDNLCLYCKREAETVIHAIWSCSAAQDVRGNAGSRFQKCSSASLSFAVLLDEFMYRFSKEEVELLIVIARRIWLRRNTLIFEGIFRHPAEVFKGAVSTLEEFKRCNHMELTAIESNNLPTMARQKNWQPPPSGIIKINWDAAINVKEGCIGLGIVARDCRGEILGAQCSFKSIVVDAKTTEAMAAFWAVLFSKAEGFLDAIFEGDSAQVVAEVSSSPPYLSKNGTESINQEIKGFWMAKFAQVHRECNSTAHVLAKEASNFKLAEIWLQESPECISSIIVRERLCP